MQAAQAHGHAADHDGVAVTDPHVTLDGAAGARRRSGPRAGRPYDLIEEALRSRSPGLQGTGPEDADCDDRDERLRDGEAASAPERGCRRVNCENRREMPSFVCQGNVKVYERKGLPTGPEAVERRSLFAMRDFRRLNFRMGLFRIWVAGSCAWILSVCSITIHDLLTEDPPYYAPRDAADMIIQAIIVAIGASDICVSGLCCFSVDIQMDLPGF